MYLLEMNPVWSSSISVGKYYVNFISTTAGSNFGNDYQERNWSPIFNVTFRFITLWYTSHQTLFLLLLLRRRSSRSDVQFSVFDVGCCPPQVLQGAIA